MTVVFPTVKYEVAWSAILRDQELTASFTGAAGVLAYCDSGQFLAPLRGTWSQDGAGHAYQSVINPTGTLGGLLAAYAGSNGTTQVTLVTTADSAGLAFRIQDHLNYWRLRTNNAGSNYLLEKNVAGTVTLVSTIAVAPANGDVLAVTHESSSLSVSINGTVVATLTDSTFVAAARVGIFAGVLTTARFSALSFAFTWTDISDHVYGGSGAGSPSFSRGKAGSSAVLDQPQTGTMKLTLDNHDRSFDSTFAAGPYFGNLLPNKRIRSTATWLGVDYRRFTGYIESFPMTYGSAGSESLIGLTCIDALALLNLRPVGYLEPAVLIDGPLAYYRCNEPSGTTLTDDTGNGNDATVIGSTAGSGVAVAGPNRSVNLAVGDYVSIPAAVAPKKNLSFSIEYRAITNDSTTHFDFYVNAANRSLGACRALMQNNGLSPGFTIQENGVANTATFNTQISGTHTAHWVWVRNAETKTWKLYFNGADVGGPGQSWTTVPDLGIPTFFMLTTPSGSMNVEEIAVFDYALTPTQIAARASGVGPSTTSASGRFSKVADLIAWPANRRIVTASSGEASPALAFDEVKTALAHFKDAATADGAMVYIDGAGNLVWGGRSKIIGQGVPSWSFGDHATDPAEVAYYNPVISLDVRRLFNDVRVTVGSTEYQAQDHASIRENEQRLYSASASAGSLSLTQWLLAMYRTAKLRIDAISVDPFNDGGVWDKILPLEIGSRVKAIRRPGGISNPAITLDLIVVGLAETNVGLDHWAITYQLQAVPPGWILGDSVYGVLGVTTVLYF